MIRIIFVCHGNICRSPAAEWIMKRLLLERGLEKEFEITSKATSLEEIGNDIYPPMKRALSAHGIAFNGHSACRITQQDYEKADHVYYMDSHNRRYLDSLIDDHKGIVEPITKFTPTIPYIDDPWYTGDFDGVVRELIRCCDDIIEALRGELG